MCAQCGIQVWQLLSLRNWNHCRDGRCKSFVMTVITTCVWYWPRSIHWKIDEESWQHGSSRNKSSPLTLYWTIYLLPVFLWWCCIDVCFVVVLCWRVFLVVCGRPGWWCYVDVCSCGGVVLMYILWWCCADVCSWLSVEGLADIVVLTCVLVVVLYWCMFCVWWCCTDVCSCLSV